MSFSCDNIFQLGSGYLSLSTWQSLELSFIGGICVLYTNNQMDMTFNLRVILLYNSLTLQFQAQSHECTLISIFILFDFICIPILQKPTISLRIHHSMNLHTYASFTFVQ